jgi:hypothetical protein
MWWSRKEKADEDAELRELLRTYSRLHPDTKSPNNAKPQPLTQSSRRQKPPSTPSPGAADPEERPDEVIKGNSFDYTRAEAEMYANEEPCNSWHHIDVFILFHAFANSNI